LHFSVSDDWLMHCNLTIFSAKILISYSCSPSVCLEGSRRGRLGGRSKLISYSSQLEWLC